MGREVTLWRRVGKKLAMSLDIDLIKACDAEIAHETSENTKSRGRDDGSNGYRDCGPRENTGERTVRLGGRRKRDSTRRGQNGGEGNKNMDGSERNG